MSRDKMQAAFDEAMADTLEDVEASGVPLWLLRVAFELGYLAGQRAELAEALPRVERAIAAASL